MGVRFLTPDEIAAAVEEQIRGTRGAMARIMAMLQRAPAEVSAELEQEARESWTKFFSELVIDDGKPGAPS